MVLVKSEHRSQSWDSSQASRWVSPSTTSTTLSPKNVSLLKVKTSHSSSMLSKYILAESILVPEVRAWWPPPFRFAALQPETPQKRLACYSPPTPFTVQKSPWFSIASSSIADHTLAIACSSSNLALRIGDLHLGIKACMRSALGVWKVGGGHSTWYRRRFLGIGSTYWGRRRQHPAISAL